MPKITINEREIEVAEGTTVLQAALAHGIEIPHYCWHPGLSISGNCRMCLVEVEKAPKLLIACSTVATDGLVVRTDTEAVHRARRAVMEFLLINHPLDCPICDQAGECRLQEYAVEHGSGESRYSEEKLALAKAVDIGPHVMLDQERCIQCSRCIRFCDEITGTGELAFFHRGEHSQIGIVPGKRLDNPYSGNVVDLCPVGALTLKEFRFKARVWFVENTSSVCAGCERGCNVTVGVHSYEHYQPGRIRRIVPRPNPEVNGHWICDEGRLSYQRLEAAPRLETAKGTGGEELEWSAAVSTLAKTLGASAGAGRLGAVLSPRLTCEDFYAWRKLFEGLGDVNVGVRRIVRGEDDELLLRANKGANATGAKWVFGPNATEESVFESIRAGEIDTLLVVGDSLDPEDTTVVDDGLRAKLKSVLYVGPFAAGPAEGAAVSLPATAWSEEDGRIVNFEGRIQQVRRCTVSKTEARPGWRIAADLASAEGIGYPAWSSADDVWTTLATAIRRFEGIEAEAVGMGGFPGGEAGKVDS